MKIRTSAVIPALTVARIAAWTIFTFFSNRPSISAWGT
jgi:hypothetical protein